ncbi:GFA family protein [Cereibacter azotoformans]|uniref:Glutathione-dependent formaldehyde-activating, GFA n=1 Tax=Cereibacter sphaeroides (strain ATCC 17025 / ATH 2.4.3) TaxID=349102 RepID=A4WWA3_CERS5|nr:GFA family protein [Cereibacter azotoformans]ULB11068.1 GFA family protein [Cereibacter azotoformans]
MTAERTGHCLCGAVAVAVTRASHEIGACHCEMCRRWTGSAFVTMMVPEAALTVTGADHVRRYASSGWAERCFCGTCGSTLWYRLTAPGMPRDHYLAAGLLDDLSGIRLAHEIYIDRKPDAWSFAGPTHQMTEAEFLATLPASPEE